MTTIKETPKQLSRIALTLIEENPEQWNQEVYHEQTECGTCHCYAGWIDHYLSNTYPENLESIYYNQDIPFLETGDETSTFWNIQFHLELTNFKYDSIVNSTNTYEELVNLHNEYFNDDYSI